MSNPQTQKTSSVGNNAKIPKLSNSTSISQSAKDLSPELLEPDHSTHLSRKQQKQKKAQDRKLIINTINRNNNNNKDNETETKTEIIKQDSNHDTSKNPQIVTNSQSQQATTEDQISDRKLTNIATAESNDNSINLQNQNSNSIPQNQSQKHLDLKILKQESNPKTNNQINEQSPSSKNSAAAAAAKSCCNNQLCLERTNSNANSSIINNNNNNKNLTDYQYFCQVMQQPPSSASISSRRKKRTRVQNQQLLEDISESLQDMPDLGGLPYFQTDELENLNLSPNLQIKPENRFLIFDTYKKSWYRLPKSFNLPQIYNDFQIKIEEENLKLRQKHFQEVHRLANLRMENNDDDSSLQDNIRNIFREANMKINLENQSQNQQVETGLRRSSSADSRNRRENNNNNNKNNQNTFTIVANQPIEINQPEPNLNLNQNPNPYDETDDENSQKSKFLQQQNSFSKNSDSLQNISNIFDEQEKLELMRRQMKIFEKMTEKDEEASRDAHNHDANQKFADSTADLVNKILLDRQKTSEQIRQQLENNRNMTKNSLFQLAASQMANLPSNCSFDASIIQSLAQDINNKEFSSTVTQNTTTSPTNAICSAQFASRQSKNNNNNNNNKDSNQTTSSTNNKDHHTIINDQINDRDQVNQIAKLQNNLDQAIAQQINLIHTNGEVNNLKNISINEINSGEPFIEVDDVHEGNNLQNSLVNVGFSGIQIVQDQMKNQENVAVVQSLVDEKEEMELNETGILGLVELSSAG